MVRWKKQVDGFFFAYVVVTCFSEYLKISTPIPSTAQIQHYWWWHQCILTCRCVYTDTHTWYTPSCSAPLYSFDGPHVWLENPCCRQMPSNEKVNCKQHDKAGRRVSGPVGDLAFRDVSISQLERSNQLSAALSVVKDTRPIRAYRI